MAGDSEAVERPRPAGFALSASALVGLYFIQRYRFLTIVQFARAAGLKPSFSAELLRSLEARHFLGYFGNVGMRGHGKTPKVYYLTRKGFELLRRESDIPDEVLGTFKETFIASAMAKASARVSPSVTTSGNAGTVTVNPPSG
jgi:hypothetical protein